MKQRLRAERALGTSGALGLWVGGGLLTIGLFNTYLLVAGVICGAAGAGLLVAERRVANANMRARLEQNGQSR